MTASVARLSTALTRHRPVRTCPVCERPPRWQIGSRHVSCDDHLSDVITTAYREANGGDE